ncbi:MAG: hypothetical protein R2792_00555 [Saprospiraceae bacterium]
MKIVQQVLLLLFFSIFTACGSDDSQNNSSGNSYAEEQSERSSSEQNNLKDTPKNMEEALRQVKDQMKDLQQSEPVNFRELQALLPESLAGYERTSKEGQTAGAMGFKVSTAEATYKDGNKKVEIDIVDMGGINMASMGMASWASLEIDKEDENGFERTTTIHGNKAYEKQNNRTGESEVALLLYDRFVVKSSSYDAGVKELRSIVTAIKTEKLKGLK